MSSLNRWMGIGNLGQDPEVKYMPNGNAIANISLAINDSWKDRDGNRQESTEWVTCVLFGRLAEIAGEYLAKGSKVFIEGRLKTETFEKDGNKRYATKVYVSNMQMLDKHEKKEKPKAKSAPSEDIFNDDIPF